MMLDLILIQLFMMGAIFWRAAHERFAWDRAGFILLGCSCALMTLRRVTSPMDDFLSSDKVVLPLMISWVLATAAACFAAEMFVRLRDPNQHRHPDYAGPKRYFWPFLWFFFVVGLDFAPAQWNGEGAALLPADQARHIAISGPNRYAAIEQVRYETARNLDVLFLVSSEPGPVGDNARRKLNLLLDRLETLRCPQSPPPTAPETPRPSLLPAK